MCINGLMLGWATSGMCKEMQKVPISTSYFRFPRPLSPLSKSLTFGFEMIDMRLACGWEGPSNPSSPCHSSFGSCIPDACSEIPGNWR